MKAECELQLFSQCSHPEFVSLRAYGFNYFSVVASDRNEWSPVVRRLLLINQVQLRGTERITCWQIFLFPLSVKFDH
jgi:hypothetical protein